MASKLQIRKLKNLGDEGNHSEAGQVDTPSPITELGTPHSSTQALQRRRLFMKDADILIALGKEPQLIGDLSRPCALPCLLDGTRHSDLKTISSDTLARLIQGEFAEQLSPGGGYQVIDCRYPYEFAGGHIRGARNLYTTNQILETFPSLGKTEEQATAAAPRLIYVFYCEFSSERGPKLLRFLRNHDRRQNAENYPRLDYPELYLLHQGYNAFHGLHVDLCEPRRYVRMLSPAHRADYRRCRLQVRLGSASAVSRLRK